MTFNVGVAMTLAHTKMLSLVLLGELPLSSLNMSVKNRTLIQSFNVRIKN